MLSGIWGQPGYTGREFIKGLCGARLLGYSTGWGANHPETHAPIGDVEWCERILGYSPTPDFAPTWLSGWLRRDVSIASMETAPRRLFAKSSESYKKFPARIYEAGESLPSESLVVSDVVEFTQEWRYYVADGCVLATGWYDGNDDDEPAPSISVEWPTGWCGAVDFGRLTTGEIALVESQHPYACGWYGDDHAAYAMWVIEGWEWMLSRPRLSHLHQSG